MENILDRIVADKRAELERTIRQTPLEELRRRAARMEQPRDFVAAVTRPTSPGIHLIAEIKRRSPSAGVIRADFDPAAIARVYHAAGASAISVLTDERYFDGRLEYVRQVRAAVPLPILRKDFVIDAYQVWEARAAGADAVLLIAEVLDETRISAYARLAGDLGMAALVEAYRAERLESVVAALGAPLPANVLLGVNNRDLTVQRTDLATTGRLAGRLPDTSRLVSESGIRTRADVLLVQQAGARAVLVGEAIMSAPDMAGKIRELLGTTPEG